MRFSAIVIVLLACTCGVVRAGADLAPRVYRVSALIQGAQGYLVGFVDPASGQSFYVPEGGAARGLAVVKVDYAAERILMKVGGESRELYLTDDPDSRTVKVASAPEGEPYLDDLTPTPEEDAPPTPAEPSAGLKAMMAQFPEAVPTNLMTQPNAIQAFLEQHPELAVKMKPSQGRYGSGIESMMKLYPALSNQLGTAVSP
jgi:hypothetical protein